MLVSNVCQWCFLLSTILNSCAYLESAEVESGDQKQVYKRNADRQRMRRNRNRWANFRRMNHNQSNWQSFTPRLPTPDEVDCYIEVEVRETKDGRCVRLGGQFQTAVCQSGMHLDFFNNNCEAILAQREAGGSAGVTRQANPGRGPRQDEK